MSSATAQALGLAEGSTVTVSTDTGSVSLPLRFAEVADHTVWTPLNSEGSAVVSIGAEHGSIVRVSGGSA